MGRVRTDTHTGGNISENCDFRGKLHIRPKQLAEQWRERAFPEPLIDRIENQFVASICVSRLHISCIHIKQGLDNVLLPTAEFIIDSQ